MNGNELRELRGKLQLTQQQLSTALGVSMRSLSRWESADLPVPSEVIGRLRNMTRDDTESLARFSSFRLLSELMSRAEKDTSGLWGAPPSEAKRLRAVASKMADKHGKGADDD